ncbi:MAG: universal stress protein [Deltaproteobacteria bacterium]|nr:universal stress protein [Deltaproteobacteria bacterium]
MLARAGSLPLRRDATVSTLELRGVARRVPDVVLATAPELVVIGDAGPLGLRLAWLMGRAPVLLARTAGDARYRRVLLAFGAKAASPELVRTACDLVPQGAVMASVHVETGGDPARGRVARALTGAGRSGAGWTRHFSYGEVRSVIARTAEDTGADLVVLSSRARNPFSRVLLGSIGCDVARKVACDVLFLPTETPVR